VNKKTIAKFISIPHRKAGNLNIKQNYKLKIDRLFNVVKVPKIIHKRRRTLKNAKIPTHPAAKK